MIRKDRQITDRGEMLALLLRCDTVRVAMNTREGYPYIVPLSFGAEEADGRVTLYFHGAARGQKIDALTADGRVCVEADVFHKVEETSGGVTTRYESVIGFGTACAVDGEQKVRGLRLVLEHYGFGGYPVESCGALAHTAVYKIELSSLTGKRNLPTGD